MSDQFVLGDKELTREFRRLREAVPQVTEHRQALKALASDYTYIRKYADNSWVTLVKPGEMLAGRFGLTRDIMLIYTAGHELQPAALRTFARRRTELPRDKSCEDHFVVLSSPDPMAANKLAAWAQTEAVLGLNLERNGRPETLATALLIEMQRKLASRNLYDETLPVTGADFFGRRKELTQLQDELRQGKVCGVFGLRKTGKTSLVKELGRRFTLADERRIFVLCDLESLPSENPRLRVEMIQELRQGFLAQFKDKGIKRGPLAELPLEAGVGEFKRALKYCLSDCDRRAFQVVLALDEIEYLVGDAATLESSHRPEVPELLGALRSLVQEHSNFNVVLSGITSSIVHRSDLYGVENPLFNWAKAYYIEPMTRSEINNLTIDVGRKMGITWTAGALDALYASSQGNVFMHRTLAARVASKADHALIALHFDAPEVEAVKRAWRRGISERLEQMFKSFERNYVTEAGLLRLAGAEDLTWEEVEAEYPAELNRLVELSLVVEDSAGDLKFGPLAQTLKDARII